MGAGFSCGFRPRGGRSWKLAYRFDGAQRKLSIGPYPAIGLAEARAARDEAKALLARGEDPGQAKKANRAARAADGANTFGAIAAELLQKKRREGRAVTTIAKTEWLLSFATDIEARPIAAITAAEVLSVLRVVEAKGRLETARRLRSVIGEVFRYGIATARAANDPTFGLRGSLATPQVKHRAAITDPLQLGGLLRAIETFDGQPATVAALQLMALLFPRPGELRLARWGEFDLDAAVWSIPASRTKMRREHRVPLSRQALSILRGLKPSENPGELVFKGYGTSGRAGQPIQPRPISENTMNAALRRMGYGQDEMTAHGFRAAASTLLNESGQFSADAIERALAHQEADAVRRAYQRGQHWQERVQMSQWWADHLDALKNRTKP